MSTKKSKETVKTAEPKENKRFVIHGKAFWAHTTEVNRFSNKFQLDLSIDDQTVEDLESKGIEIKNNEKDRGKEELDRGNHVTLKSDYPPKVFDSKKNPMSPKIAIGNGSIVNIATHVYDWKFGGKTGKSLGLDAIQVIDLVEFKDNSSNLFEETDEGFVTDSDVFDDVNAAEDTDDSEVVTARTPKVTKTNPF